MRQYGGRTLKTYLSEQMSHRHEFRTTMQLGCFLDCGCRASWAERCSECGSAARLPPQVRQRPADRSAEGRHRGRLVATAAGRKHHKSTSVSASQHDVCSSNPTLWIGSMTCLQWSVYRFTLLYSMSNYETSRCCRRSCNLAPSRRSQLMPQGVTAAAAMAVPPAAARMRLP